MNFCVAPQEIQEINKRGRGGQIKLRGGGFPTVYFEPESISERLFI